MSTLATLLVKARKAGRPVVDLMREHGEAGCPEFDPAHPFWAGMVESEIESLNDLRELRAASAQLNQSEPAPEIATCQDCLALYPAGESCPACAVDEKK